VAEALDHIGNTVEALLARMRKTCSGETVAFDRLHVREVLVACSPLEPDTAYMKVPRCDSCAWWTRGTIPVIDAPSVGGTCVNPHLQVHAEGAQAIETSEMFGCVQWEGRDEGRAHT
jgi:hypothetical protein